MLYVVEIPEQGVADPVIAPGVAGAVVGITAKVAAEDVPQVPVAVTLTLPAIALGVAEILVVVDVPVQPPGNVQV